MRASKGVSFAKCGRGTFPRAMESPKQRSPFRSASAGRAAEMREPVRVAGQCLIWSFGGVGSGGFFADAAVSH